jgi:hypothetical protein
VLVRFVEGILIAVAGLTLVVVLVAMAMHQL